MDATVIVCTYDRARSLIDTLAALAAQRVAPSVQWEVIVVDNNSRDDTAAVVAKTQALRSIANLRYQFESQQGLSAARNRGIAAARGDIVLFTDDDVLPETDWLAAVLAAMKQHDCDACGGYIGPIWEAVPPAWLTERFHGFLAIRTDTAGPFEIDERKDPPFGANMAFRRAVFEKVGRFDTSMGRKGRVLAGGEEFDLFRRVLRSGAKVMYFPQARVRHRIEASRLTKRYLRRWRYQGSRNIAQSEGVPGERRLLGVPLYLLPQTWRAILRALASRFTAPADEAFMREMIVWHFFGLIAGLLAKRRNAARG